MLPPIVRTLLSWASFGVAVGVVASLATLVVLRAEPDAVRVPEVLIIVPIPLGLVAGFAAGSTVASTRGATMLGLVAFAVALFTAAFAPLAPVPIVFATACARIQPSRWHVLVAAVTVVMAAGVGLIGVPLELAAADVLPRGLGFVVGLGVGVACAALLIRPRAAVT